MINTIRENYEGFTKLEIDEAKMAQCAVAMLGHHSKHEFLGRVHSKMIKNCCISLQAIINAYKIYGPDLAGVRGRTTRTTTERASVEYVEIPRSNLELHVNIGVGADVMFVNGISFLITVAPTIKLITIKYMETQTATQLSLCLQ